jgi:hypothetical protein
VRGNADRQRGKKQNKKHKTIYKICYWQFTNAVEKLEN